MRGPGSRWRGGATRVLSVLVIAWVGVGVGCDRKRSYSQTTPDDVLVSARRMLENEDVERLHELLHADSPEMRAFLYRVGVMLGNLYELGNVVQEEFPEEIEELKAEAQAAAERGESTSILSMLRPGRRRGPPSGDQEEAFGMALRGVFADPFGWLEASEDRLATEYIADDMAAITWDGKPVPPFGMVMREVEGKWYVVLPTNLPFIARAMPKTFEEWSIWASLVKVIDNMLVDLAKDVRGGKANNLDNLGRLAGRKAFMPAMMVFVAYGRAMEYREEEAKQAAEARKAEEAEESGDD